MTPAQVIPLLARRRIEAEILARVFAALSERVGEQPALEVIAEAVEAAAEAAGRDFAATAPGGTSLAHFSEVIDRWREGRALAVEDVRLSGSALEFRVTRCAYAELYRTMGLPPALARVLSCRRDAAFARGYDRRLRLDRPATLLDGAPACPFRFHLDPE